MVHDTMDIFDYGRFACKIEWSADATFEAPGRIRTNRGFHASIASRASESSASSAIWWTESGGKSRTAIRSEERRVGKECAL